MMCRTHQQPTIQQRNDVSDTHTFSAILFNGRQFLICFIKIKIMNVCWTHNPNPIIMADKMKEQKLLEKAMKQATKAREKSDKLAQKAREKSDKLAQKAREKSDKLAQKAREAEKDAKQKQDKLDDLNRISNLNPNSSIADYFVEKDDMISGENPNLISPSGSNKKPIKSSTDFGKSSRPSLEGNRKRNRRGGSLDGNNQQKKSRMNDEKDAEEHPVYAKYCKMLKIGIPFDDVKNLVLCLPSVNTNRKKVEVLLLCQQAAEQEDEQEDEKKTVEGAKQSEAYQNLLNLHFEQMDAEEKAAEQEKSRRSTDVELKDLLEEDKRDIEFLKKLGVEVEKEEDAEEEEEENDEK
jgi:hypothetical protein